MLWCYCRLVHPLKQLFQTLLPEQQKMEEQEETAPSSTPMPLDKLGMRKLFQLVTTIIYHGSDTLQRALQNADIRSFIADEPLTAWREHTQSLEHMFRKSNLYQAFKVNVVFKKFALLLLPLRTESFSLNDISVLISFWSPFTSLSVSLLCSYSYPSGFPSGFSIRSQD